MSSGIFLLLVSMFLLAFPLIHFVFGGGGRFWGFCKSPRDNFDCQRRFINKD